MPCFTLLFQMLTEILLSKRMGQAFDVQWILFSFVLRKTSLSFPLSYGNIKSVYLTFMIFDIIGPNLNYFLSKVYFQ